MARWIAVLLLLLSGASFSVPSDADVLTKPPKKAALKRAVLLKDATGAIVGRVVSVPASIGFSVDGTVALSPAFGLVKIEADISGPRLVPANEGGYVWGLVFATGDCSGDPVGLTVDGHFVAGPATLRAADGLTYKMHPWEDDADVAPPGGGGASYREDGGPCVPGPTSAAPATRIELPETVLPYPLRFE
jgi:hypothetical protein